MPKNLPERIDEKELLLRPVAGSAVPTTPAEFNYLLKVMGAKLTRPNRGFVDNYYVQIAELELPKGERKLYKTLTKEPWRN